MCSKMDDTMEEEIMPSPSPVASPSSVASPSPVASPDICLHQVSSFGEENSILSEKDQLAQTIKE